MTAEPAVLLDVTRLISRLGQGPLTGIDRVEAAWLGHLQGRDHLLLARLGRAQVVLPPDAGADLLRWVGGDATGLPQASMLGRVLGRTGPRARARLAFAGRAVLRGPASGRGLGRRVARRLGAGVYLNTGHSNLTAPLLRALSPLCRTVLIHDTIPLDHPDLTRTGQDTVFRARLSAVLAHADLVAAISPTTRDDVLRWRDTLGIAHHAPVTVAPIGTTLAAPAPVPPDLDLSRPYFVTLGTIEPRKNHALLLDAWDLLVQRLPFCAVPQLFVIGRRGWCNEAVFARLDALPAGGPVREMNDLDDGAVAALMQGAHALLMPSRSEGFGLPLTEAAARGTPVLCAPLPTARDLLGDDATYLPADNPRVWADAIAAMASTTAAVPQSACGSRLERSFPHGVGVLQCNDRRKLIFG